MYIVSVRDSPCMNAFCVVLVMNRRSHQDVIDHIQDESVFVQQLFMICFLMQKCERIQHLNFQLYFPPQPCNLMVTGSNPRADCET